MGAKVEQSEAQKNVENMAMRVLCRAGAFFVLTLLGVAVSMESKSEYSGLGALLLEVVLMLIAALLWELANDGTGEG